jgi:hypothetical protein
MDTSLLKTLTNKHRSSVSKMARTLRPLPALLTRLASAGEPGSNAMAGSHWSHGSAVFR